MKPLDKDNIGKIGTLWVQSFKGLWLGGGGEGRGSEPKYEVLIIFIFSKITSS
jgi:hypothetical protein